MLFASMPHARSIRSVDLKHCSNVTDEVVAIIARTSPAMQSVSLEGCVQVTDQSLVALAQHCKTLDTLDLSWCPAVTQKGIVLVMDELSFMLRLACRGIGRGYVRKKQSLGGGPPDTRQQVSFKAQTRAGARRHSTHGQRGQTTLGADIQGHTALQI